jgi:hypothetical protein
MSTIQHAHSSQPRGKSDLGEYDLVILRGGARSAILPFPRFLPIRERIPIQADAVEHTNGCLEIWQPEHRLAEILNLYFRFWMRGPVSAQLMLPQIP